MTPWGTRRYLRAAIILVSLVCLFPTHAHAWFENINWAAVGMIGAAAGLTVLAVALTCTGVGAPGAVALGVAAAAIAGTAVAALSSAPPAVPTATTTPPPATPPLPTIDTTRKTDFHEESTRTEDRGGGGGGGGGDGQKPGGGGGGGSPGDSGGRGPSIPDDMGAGGGVPTPFFGIPGSVNPNGASQEYMPPSKSGIKGMAEIPGFQAGTACRGSDAAKCGNHDKTPVPLSFEGGKAARDNAAGSGSHYIGSSGSGSGGMSLASLLTDKDKPAGFRQLEAKVAGAQRHAAPDASKDAAGAVPEGSAPSVKPPEDFEGQVRLMGGAPVPGDVEHKVQELLEQAQREMKHREFAAAIKDLTEAIKLSPQNAELYVSRAMAYNLSGDFANAEKDALAAIRLDPQNSKAWENLAWAQLKQGKYKEAIESATAAVRLDPKNALAYAIRAFAEEKLGINKAKMDDITRAAALDSRFIPMLRRGRAGLPIYDANADYTDLFLEKGLPPKAPEQPVWILYLAASMLGVSLLALAGALVYRYRKSGAKDLKGFMESLKKGLPATARPGKPFAFPQ